MKMVSSKRVAMAVFLTGAYCMVSGFVCGHAVCMRQHASLNDILDMTTKNGRFSYLKYFKNIVKDYKNMYEDFFLLERSLE